MMDQSMPLVYLPLRVCVSITLYCKRNMQCLKSVSLLFTLSVPLSLHGVVKTLSIVNEQMKERKAKKESSQLSDQINYYRAITCDFRAVGSSDYVTKNVTTTHIQSQEYNNFRLFIILFASTLSRGLITMHLAHQSNRQTVYLFSRQILAGFCQISQ